MILVMGGTSEGRTIASMLASRGARVLVSTATRYGAHLAGSEGIEVIHGRLDLEGLADLIVSKRVHTLVDASHPFATEVTGNAAGACAGTGARYIRYARPQSEIIDHPLVKRAENYERAAHMAFDTGKTVFLTTGSKTAGLFIKRACRTGGRVIIRLVPDPAAIDGLIKMGVSPSDIVAIKGPFSKEMNSALLKHFSPDVLVTKESGEAGGLGDKISAAVDLGLPVIVISRPPEPYGAVMSLEEAVDMALV